MKIFSNMNGMKYCEKYLDNFLKNITKSRYVYEFCYNRLLRLAILSKKLYTPIFRFSLIDTIYKMNSYKVEGNDCNILPFNISIEKKDIEYEDYKGDFYNQISSYNSSSYSSYASYSYNTSYSSYNFSSSYTSYGSYNSYVDLAEDIFKKNIYFTNKENIIIDNFKKVAKENYDTKKYTPNVGYPCINFSSAIYDCIYEKKAEKIPKHILHDNFVKGYGLELI